MESRQLLFKPPVSSAQLLPHYIVVKPNEIEVKKILDQYPRWLLIKIEQVVDQSDRTIINSTPLQLAYGAGDVEMCQGLKPYFEQICGGVDAGQKEIHNQLHEKFEEENKEKNEGNAKQIKNHLASLLALVIQAITIEQFNHGRNEETNQLILSEVTLTAIERFRKKFDESQPKVIDKGMHFRLEILQELYEKYAKIAQQQWDYDDKKCALLEDGVLSYVLRYVPENDAQRFKQGLCYLQDEGEKFSREKKMRNGRDFRQVLLSSSRDFVLPGSYVDIIWGVGGWKGRTIAPTWAAAALQNLCRAKTSDLQSLFSPVSSCPKQNR
ncbi:MAG TPA: hypothetical protein VJN02_02450 [Gammaproteobacteria bacterium]|nr:hypothetical protein [Gammaproteobacteria bacterium]